MSKTKLSRRAMLGATAGVATAGRIMAGENAEAVGRKG